MESARRQALLTRYRDGYRAVAEAVAGLTDAELDQRPGDGSWSGDPYITAVAIRALQARGASVTSGSSGITGLVIDAHSGLPLEGESEGAP